MKILSTNLDYERSRIDWGKEKWNNTPVNLSESILNKITELVKIKSISNTPEENIALEYIEKQIIDIFSANNKKNLNYNLKKVWINNNWVFKWWLVCNIKNNICEKNIILMWHVDVVPVKSNLIEEWETDPFNIAEDENNLYWRWTCDMKSGLWIMLELIKESTNEKLENNYNLSFIFSTWEETWMPNWLSEIIEQWELPKADFSITLEPTEWRINTWVFWYMVWKFIINWLSCHSSNPSLWENAIEQSMNLFKILLEQKMKLESFSWVNEVFEITKINWWTAANIIPNQVEYTVNHRYLPWKDYAEKEKYLTNLAKLSNSDLIIHEHNPSSLVMELENPILNKVIQATKNDISSLNLVPFWSDMAQTSINWIPSINYWPWSIKQAHTTNEFVSKKSINEVYSALKNLLFKQ